MATRDDGSGDAERAAASGLQICSDCGRAYVGWHKCRDELSRRKSMTTEVRESLSEADGGDPEETVVYLPGRGDSAYHKAEQVRGDDGQFAGLEPVCDAVITVETTSTGNERGWIPAPRREVRENSPRYPCRECHDLDSALDKTDP